MTTRWPWLVVTMLCCLLAVAASAAAESVWVLWKQEAIAPPNAKPSKDGWGPVRRIEWTRVEGKSSRKDCEELLLKTPVPSRDVYHVCFPDTVDPRGPKGK